MKKITFNDGIGHRGRQHLNLLVGRLATGEQVLVEFKGADIPGFAKIEAENFDKNGKWSSTTYTVIVPDDAESFTFDQDWGTGMYFPRQTWEAAIKHLQQIAKNKKVELNADAIQRFVYHRFPVEAKLFNEAKKELDELSSEALAPLLLAQQELQAVKQQEAAIQAEVQQMEEIEKIKEETARTTERAQEAKKLLKKGASLADIKSALGYNGHEEIVPSDRT